MGIIIYLIGCFMVYYLGRKDLIKHGYWTNRYMIKLMIVSTLSWVALFLFTVAYSFEKINNNQEKIIKPFMKLKKWYNSPRKSNIKKN